LLAGSASGWGAVRDKNAVFGIMLTEQGYKGERSAGFTH